MSVLEDMEDAARGGRDPSRFTPFAIFEAVLIVASFIIVGLFLYAAQFSGTVRWLMSFALLAGVALFGWMFVSAETAEPPPLEPEAERAETMSGDLSLFSAVVRRANEGLPYSQVLATTRAREAFAERARLALGLSAESMRHACADRAALGSLVHDPVLVDLLYLPSTDPKERARWVHDAKRRGGFPRAFRQVLDRIEVWR